MYINTDKSISLAGAGDFAVVRGANHLLLRYAVYTSVGIFNTSGLAVGLVTDDIKLNSAQRFAPHLPDIDKFYCVEIRSECHDDPYCVQPLFENTKTVLVQFRVNLNPHTKTGPAMDELIWPLTAVKREKICEKQEKYCKGKVVTSTVQILIPYQYPVDLLPF